MSSTLKTTASPVTAIIVGAGHRAIGYADVTFKHPELLRIVGVADPDPVRRQVAMERYGFGENMCFHDANELAARGKLADAVINGTLDRLHVETSLPLLDAGYDMLLEKPFALNEGDALTLTDCAASNGAKVMICHVLRYAPFYSSIKERILRGDLGEIINIQMAEHVGYHHMSIGYVRGKWSNSERSCSSMLLAKSCHDMDLMMWLMGETRPTAVASFGGRYQFRPENAPPEAGTVCMVDCPLVDTCEYSSKRLYIDHPDRWGCYIWDALEHLENPGNEDRIALMKSDSPYARCVYKSDNNVVDRQSVMVQFASGATGTLNMVGGAARDLRTITIIGTRGEIRGSFESGTYTFRHPNPAKEGFSGGYDEEIVDLKQAVVSDGHGGGDERMVLDFVRFVRGEPTGAACTSIFDSLIGHLCVYKADQSRENGGLPIFIP
ncbi:MAG: Gfo/Idh/MocA family oxidoreductase [Ruminococcaceae bacterium]|nr:Gfo/Idh/MocA family oxidoreductase [Oscillospiraceae bacterium]